MNSSKKNGLILYKIHKHSGSQKASVNTFPVTANNFSFSFQLLLTKKRELRYRIVQPSVEWYELRFQTVLGLKKTFRKVAVSILGPNLLYGQKAIFWREKEMKFIYRC